MNLAIVLFAILPIDDEQNKSGIAVVELFTSQGCSSCPPADDLLTRLAAERHSGLFLLAFHVDYWDYLGWQDPFGDERFSTRQRTYAHNLGERVYTPQMVVNGRRVFVGSDEQKARRIIVGELKNQTTATVELSAKRSGKKDIAIAYSVLKAGDRRLVLNVAAVTPRTEVAVRRGENAGRALTHTNVVRAFKPIRLNGQGHGKEKMTLPKSLKIEDVRLIAYLQEPRQGTIIAATVALVSKP